ncbi:MAG TPA: molecular chaperone HtpG [Candidatus Acetatifactor stercoripullorum]|uniref:Molecular chaperone HtpG n=1 Tax=Candidatus Acetatifactor stercoripullorum TaxID=2838414 RepID=A0A9D1UBR6_9FIRM|nr:molecular chaperone HtpG [Candidatus Acetatifactor stercoripullorum]HIW82019.1 molecular chaperone HtpG [Candidatus Acetatifactor stercoripullorum]
MSVKSGNLSINSENIFPIIKKWLYSDHDIFYRELISNGCDAVVKLKKLEMMGECSLPEDYKARIDVVVDPEKKTITVSDNGLGMTAEEVEEYINQIAFSGATDFIEKYKDKSNADQIIGHFGLGFYSAFMVADEVHIDSLSYKEGAKPVHWECDGGTEFSMTEGEDAGRTTPGTTITLFVNEDCLEFCNEYKAREVVKKYCSFMPTEIYLSKADTKETQIIREDEKLADDVVLEVIEPEKKESAKEEKDSQEAEDAKKEDGAEEEKPEPRKLKIKKRPELMNETTPLWTKHPNDCTREEYLEFYRKVFQDYKEPLFWIHLNMDYPFNLKGILYFPKINMEYESIEGTIKLYNNQVFIADNIKEVIPEFLLLLKGVIDCPDLPLNVSRSALQNDGFVKKISEYITKKVADKLAGMCKTEKEEYDKYWDDISPFIKFGCLKDDKFCERMNDYILFKNLEGKYLTLPECLETKPLDEENDEGKAAQGEEAEAAKEAGSAVDENGQKVEAEIVEEEKTSAGQEEAAKEEETSKEKIIYYVTDEQQQSQYINMFKAAKMDAVILTHNIDQPFISQLEAKNEGIRFRRIDADVSDTMKAKTSKKAEKELEEQAKTLGELMKKALKNDKLVVKVEKLKDKKVSSLLTLSEESRRMQDMMKMYSMPGMDMGAFGTEGETLILNANHPLVKYVTEHQDGENVEMICEQLYDLAKLQQSPLKPEEMTRFVARSNEIMMLLAK